jgi:hypothetical protein
VAFYQNELLATTPGTAKAFPLILLANPVATPESLPFSSLSLAFSPAFTRLLSPIALILFSRAFFTHHVNSSQWPIKSRRFLTFPASSSRTACSSSTAARSVRDASLLPLGRVYANAACFCLADQKEFLKLCQAVGIGFGVMGAVGFVVKLSAFLPPPLCIHSVFQKANLSIFCSTHSSQRPPRRLSIKKCLLLIDGVFEFGKGNIRGLWK